MLKQLISLFAEKFLFNKKEWVGSQGLFSNSNPGTTFSVSSGQELIYTPPADGWLTFGGDQTSVNVGIRGKMGVVCVNTKGFLRISAPVRKGDPVSLYCETTDSQPLEAKFVPSEGAA